MPTYEYACRECGQHLEVVQSFKDAPLTTCGTCGGPLRKVFSAAGIIFKGSGYYVTDTRQKPSDASGGKKGASGSKGDKADTGGKSDAGSADGGSSSSSSSGSSSSGSSSGSSSSEGKGGTAESA